MDSDRSPKSDLADRYQEMVQLQVDAVMNFDNKAWRAARVVGLIIGAILTGVSLLVGKNFDANIDQIPSIFALFVGFACLITALIFSIISYLSSIVGFGPTTDIGDHIGDNDSIDTEEYQSTIIDSYTNTIRKNNKVLKAKSRRLRYTLTSLLSAVIFISIGFLLLIFDLSIICASLVVLLGALVSSYAAYYIVQQKYAAINGKENSGED
ncbi:hypothetical protein [Halobacterium sp. KA-6]|uniref:hypothetical protein n=1 Tax=Halobacterium sp. KA-6 TaxID=2896368 RepID=UPI001E29FAE9|nr:hypothetical protein [Halobacterium sp. KA-6]MCD2204516.1 hypothetical protein [Halobacterium sp. KA-6]